jgi:hypothetical protein
MSISKAAPRSVLGPRLGPRAARPIGLWLLPLLLGVFTVYALWSSAGNFRQWPVYSALFDLLGEGFRRGQLYLPVTPAPQLLAAANPYDRANGRYWIIDATLHDSKWYLYWGPLPSLLQALIKSALGIYTLIGDQYLVLAFSLLSTGFGALLIEDIRLRMFSRVPRWVSVLCVLALAFANPVPYLVSTAGQYQAAIAGGQTFLVAGMWCAFRAVQRDMTPARARRWLLLAGAAFGAALSCRISVTAAAALVALLAACVASWGRGWRALCANAACIAAAPLVSVSLLLLYNHARFGRWLDFGMKEQVSYFEFKLSARYLLTNLYAYALSPFEWTCQFPYALQSMARGPKSVPAWVPRAPDYVFPEPISGFLASVPLTWLFPVPLVVVARHIRQLKREAWRNYAFCALSFALLGSISGALVLFVYAATMRYLGDFIYGLALLSVLGAFTWIASRRSVIGRRFASAVTALLCAASIALGLLLGYLGYNDHFPRFNPALNQVLVQRLSVCPSAHPK